MSKGGIQDVDFNFPLRLFGVIVVIALLSAYPLFTYATSEVIHACVAGAVLSLVNVLCGFAAIEYAFDKPDDVFYKTVFGGMVLRLMFVLGAMVMLIEIFRVNVPALAFSLMFFYVIFLIMEIVFIQQKINLRKQR
jgi:hypothetical protein